MNEQTDIFSDSNSRLALQMLKNQGLTFDEILAVYGETADTSPYLRVARFLEGGLKLEFDDRPVIFKGARPAGAYVLLRTWISDEDVLEMGYRCSGIRISSVLEELVSLAIPAMKSITTDQDRCLLALQAYWRWLRITMTAFENAIDLLETQPVDLSVLPEPV